MDLGRRRFLTWASASAAWIAAHPVAAWGNTVAERSVGPRILRLELLSATPLQEMKAFYHDALGLRIVEERKDRLTVAAGGSRLTFSSAGAGDGEPFYHFAFNIPENKILRAREWQLERGPLMPIPPRLRDPDYPDDVVNFSHWNAHSVFFFDPAGNVVEYIARHDLGNAAPGEFGSRDILHASEIGLIVDDVTATAAKLQEAVQVARYRGGDDQFTALGDERGLLLVMRRGRALNFNPADPSKAAGIFDTRVHLRGTRPTKYALPAFPYEVSVET